MCGEQPKMSFSRECLQDHLNFMIEQIELARQSPSDREAAIDAASGSIPYIRSRIDNGALDPSCSAMFALSIEREHWADIPKLKQEDFTKAADELIEAIDRLSNFISLPSLTD
jgi:hypothetical protein